MTSILNWLELLILPPGIILVVLLFALLISRRSPIVSSVLSITGILLLIVLSMPLVARYLLINLQDYPAIEMNNLNAEQSDGTIVILGAGRYSSAPEYGFRDEVDYEEDVDPIVKW